MFILLGPVVQPPFNTPLQAIVVDMAASSIHQWVGSSFAEEERRSKKQRNNKTDQQQEEQDGVAHAEEQKIGQWLLAWR